MADLSFDDLIPSSGAPARAEDGPIAFDDLIPAPGLTDRVKNVPAAFAQGAAGVVASLPKQASIVSAQIARERLRAIDEPYAPPEGDSPHERAAQRTRRGVTGRTTPETVAERRAILEDEASRPVQERPAYRLGEAIDAGMKWLAPTDPRLQDEWVAQKIPHGLGSVAGFMATGIAGRALGLPGSIPAAVAGSASQSVEMFEDAIKHKASLADAFKAANLGAVVGTSEAVPIATLLDRLDKGTGGSVKRVIRNAMVQGTEEAIQEAFQNIAGNLIANRLVGYDPERGTFTGTGEAAGLGFTVGGLAATIGHLVVGRRGRAAQQQQPANGTSVQVNGEERPDLYPQAADLPDGAVPADSVLPPEQQEAAQQPSVPAAAGYDADAAARTAAGFAPVDPLHGIQTQGGAGGVSVPDPAAPPHRTLTRALTKLAQTPADASVAPEATPGAAGLRPVDPEQAAPQERAVPTEAIAQIPRETQPLDGEVLPPAELERRKREGGQDATLDADGNLVPRGSKAAPVRVESAADIARAAAAASTDHSHEQGEANNRPLGHVKWHGLDGSIEVAAGGVRKGTNPKTGERWETTHTVPYGYWKGTKGADGMHVDVYWGPEPDADHPVYVLDELDPKTGKFRQHKTFAGFPSQQAAEQAYLGTSTKSPDMIGGVVAMPVDEFTQWVTSGPLKKPVAASVTPRDKRGTKAHKPLNLIEFLAANGGIRSDDPLIADLRAITGRKNLFVPGYGQLIRTPRELSSAAKLSGARSPALLDRAREAAAEAGYLPTNSTVADLLDLIDRDMRDGTVFAQGDEAAALERKASSDAEKSELRIKEAEDEVRAAAKAAGFPAPSAEQVREAAQATLVNDAGPLEALVDVLERDAVRFYANVVSSAEETSDDRDAGIQEAFTAAADRTGEIAPQAGERSGSDGEAAQRSPAPRGEPADDQRDRGAPDDGDEAEDLSRPRTRSGAIPRADNGHINPSDEPQTETLRKQFGKYNYMEIHLVPLENGEWQEAHNWQIAGYAGGGGGPWINAAGQNFASREAALQKALDRLNAHASSVRKGSGATDKAIETAQAMLRWIEAQRKNPAKEAAGKPANIPAGKEAAPQAKPDTQAGPGKTGAEPSASDNAAWWSELSRIGREQVARKALIPQAVRISRLKWGNLSPVAQAKLAALRGTDSDPVQMRDAPTWAQILNALPKDRQGRPDIDRADELMKDISGKARPSYGDMTPSQQTEMLRRLTEATQKPPQQQTAPSGVEDGAAKESIAPAADAPTQEERDGDESARKTSQRQSAPPLKPMDRDIFAAALDDRDTRAIGPDGAIYVLMPMLDGTTQPIRYADGKQYRLKKLTAKSRNQARENLLNYLYGKPSPKRDTSAWTEIGKNAAGQTLYQDERGVRSRIENGVRITESVGLRPKRGGGMEIEIDRTGKREWQTVEESGQQRNDESAIDSDVKAAFDAIFGADEAVKPSAPIAAKHQSRIKSDLAKSAARKAASGTKKSIVALGELFGGKAKLSSGITFDPETYAKAKPIFLEAASDFAGAYRDVAQLARLLVDELRAAGYGMDVLRNMRPYLERFVQDVKDGVIELAAGPARQTAELQAADSDETVTVTMSATGPWDFNDTWPAPDPAQLAALEAEGRSPFGPEAPDAETNAGILDETLNAMVADMAVLRAAARLRNRPPVKRGYSPERWAKEIKSAIASASRSLHGTTAEIEAVWGAAAARGMKAEARRRAIQEEKSREPLDANDVAAVDSAQTPDRATVPAPEGESDGIQVPLSDGDARTRAETVQQPEQVGPARRLRSGKGPGGKGAVRRPDGERSEGAGRLPEATLRSGGRGNRDGTDAGVSGERTDDGAGRHGERAQPEADRVTGENFSIAPGALGENRSAKTKAQDNIEAIKLLRRIEAEGRPATREEQAKLVRYVGWGGIKGAFPDTDGQFAKGFEQIGEQLRDLLSDTEYDTARRSIQYAHYTAENVVRAMWSAAEQLGFKGGKVFEPGMGVGHFAGLMPPDIAARTQYLGIELDHITAGIARLLYPRWGVRRDDFTRAPVPENTFDLAIGNPPFADIAIRSDPKYAKHGFLLHDYFFAKSLDALRPGGLLMFISSAGTMNKQDDSARRYLAERADLVGAIRLPSNAFEKNAGTEVTTDIVILRKRLPDEKPGSRNWTETVEVTLPGKDGRPVTGTMSRYFAENPLMVLGEQGFFDKLYEGRYAVRARPGADLTADLSAAVARLPRDVMSEWQSGAASANEEYDFGVSEKKEGTYYLGPKGELMQMTGGVGRPVERRGKGVEGGRTAADIERIKALIPIRDALRAVYAADLNDDAANGDRARARLNRVYDAFVAQFGPINKAEIQKRRPNLIQQEAARNEAREDARYAGVEFDEGTFDPSAMIAEGATLAQIARARQAARDEAQKNGRPFSEGSFDPDEMPDIVIDKRPNVDPFMDDPESYRLRAIERYDDVTGVATKGPVFFANFIARDTEPIISSVEDATLYVLNQRGRLDLDEIASLSGKSRSEAIEALGDRIFLEPGTADVWRTREEYLSGNVLKKLAIARQWAERNPAFRRNVEALEAVQPVPLAPAQIHATLGMPWIPPDVIETFGIEALGLESIKVKYVPKLAQWFVHGDTDSAAASSIFGTDRRRAPALLSDLLNRQQIKIYDTEKAPDGSTTTVLNIEATQAAQEKADAIRQKFDDWIWSDDTRAEALAKLYNETYNNLVVREYDGSYLTTPGISSHWTWRPHQKRVVARIIQDGNTYMAHAVGAGKTSAMIGAGMEMRRLGLVRKPMYVVPNHMLGQFTKEFYEQYPTAKIAVADERRFHTDRRKQFVANVAVEDLDAIIITHSAFGMIPVSHEFQDRLIQREIANFRELLSELKGGENRISRARVEKQIERLEQRLSGKGNKRRDQVFTFEEMGVDFLFVDEAHLFRKLDFSTKMSNLKGITPEGSAAAFDLYVKAQYLNSINPGRSLVMASGTPITNTMAELFTLSRFMQPDELAERGLAHFDAWAGAFGESVTELEQDAAGGYKPVTRFSRFVNTAELSAMVRQVMDIVTARQLEQYVSRPKLKGGKRIMNLAEKTPALERYQRTLAKRIEKIAERRGPPKPGDDIMLSVINDGRHAAIDMRLVGEKSDGKSKLDLLIDNVFRIWKETKRQKFYRPLPDGQGYETEPFDSGPATQMIFANLGLSGARGFSVPDYIRSELTRRGVPKNEIAYIYNYKTHVARQKLFNDMNEGKVRILIGSTAKMATGVNAQRRLYALHNMDPLWYPADDEQRNGRALRQGNLNPEIEIHDYATKGTYDSTMWGMMERKARFIQMFFEGDPSMRDMEDLGEASQYAQAKAITTNDPRLIRLTELWQELEKARRRENAFHQEMHALRQRRRQFESERNYTAERIAQVRADIAARTDLSGDNFKAVAGGKTYDKRAEFGEAIMERLDAIAKDAAPGQPVRIGSISGFPIFGTARKTADNRVVVDVHIERSGGFESEVEVGHSAVGLVRSLEGVINRFDRDLAHYEERLAKAERFLAETEDQAGKTFDDGGRVNELSAQIRALEAELAGDTTPADKAVQTAILRASANIDLAEIGRVTLLEPWRRQADQSHRRRLAFQEETDTFGDPDDIPDALSFTSASARRRRDARQPSLTRPAAFDPAKLDILDAGASLKRLIYDGQDLGAFRDMKKPRARAEWEDIARKEIDRLTAPQEPAIADEDDEGAAIPARPAPPDDDSSMFSSAGAVRKRPEGGLKQGGADYDLPRTRPIPASAGLPIATFRNDRPLKAHSDYVAAKAGSSEAAARLVEALVKPEQLAAARERFGPDVIYVPVLAQEATGHNAIPMLLAELYAARAGGRTTTAIWQDNRAHHTGAKAMERIVARARFAGAVEPGRRYVIVDDVSVMGSTIAELADFIQNHGGEVAGAVTLVNASRSGVLVADRDRLREIERRFGDAIKDIFGIEPASLTADEADHLLNFADIDALRARAASASRERTERLRAKGLLDEGLNADKPPFTDLGPFRLREGAPLGGQLQDYVIERGRQGGVEYLVAVDADGRIIDHGRGDRTSIGFSDRFLAAAGNPDNAIVVHHNHPSDMMLSTQDIAALMSLPGLQAVWAHGHGDGVSRAELTPQARALARQNSKGALARFYKAMAALEDLIKPFTRQAIKRNLVTVEEANFTYAEIMNAVLRDAGIIDYRSNRDVTGFIERAQLAPYLSRAVILARSTFYGEQADAGADLRDDRRAAPLRHAGDVGAVFERSEKAAREYDRQGADDRGGREVDRRDEAGQGLRSSDSASGDGDLFKTEIVETADGPREQFIIPGTERIGPREQLRRKSEAPKRSDKPQKTVDGLPLFDGEPDPTLPLFNLKEEGATYTAPERKRIMQGFLARGQYLDRAIRMPFDWFGGTNYDGTWKPGLALWKRESSAVTGAVYGGGIGAAVAGPAGIIPGAVIGGAAGRLMDARFTTEGRFAFLNPLLETARRGLIDRYGLAEDYVARDRQRALDERAVMLQGAEFLKQLKDHAVGPAEARVLQAILTGEAVSDAQMGQLAEPIRAAIDQLGQEAVALGLVSAESFERNRGTYLHRVYKKYEAEQNGLVRMVNQIMGARRKKIIGEQFKGRGMFVEIDLGRLMRDVPSFQEGKRGRPLKGERFVRLDEMPEQGQLPLDGAPATQRPIRTVWWPEDTEIPDRYARFRNQGTFEIRGMKNGKLVLWRDFTREERERMGEILDARYTIGKTFMLMAHDLATGKFYRDIAQNEDWAQSGRPDGRVMDAAEWQRRGGRYKRVEADWVKVPDTAIADTGGKKRYGALSGMYVREEIWRDINEQEIMSQPHVWRTLMTHWKLNKTVRSPVVHMNNLISNFVLMDMLDVRVQDLVAGIRSYLAGDNNYEEAFRHGAFGADMMTQEVRERVLKPVLDEIMRDNTFQQGGRLGSLGQVSRLTEILWSKLKALDQKMIDAYRIEDEIFRMAAYMRRRQLGDDPKTAADIAREQFIDYDIRAPWVNMARNTALPFISYTYRAVPLVARAIATRPWKLGKYFLLSYVLNAIAYGITGGDEDKERRSLRENEQGHTWIGTERMVRMPYNDAYGNPVFLDIRRWIPAGDVFDMSQGQSVLPVPAWINVGGPLLLGAEAFLNKQSFTGQPIVNTRTDDWWDRTAKVSDWAYKSWMPSAAYIPNSFYWDRVANAVKGATDPQGRPYSIPQALASSVGIKLKPHDVEDALARKAQDVRRTESELKAEARRLARQRSRNMIGDAEFGRQMKRIEQKLDRLRESSAETFKD